MSKIKVNSELEDGMADNIILTCDSRKKLNELVFKDLSERLRLDIDGEPLLSNKRGPAIEYNDGMDVDFCINGVITDHLHTFADSGESIEAMPEDGLLLKNAFDTGIDFKYGYLTAIFIEEEDSEPYWKILITADTEEDFILDAEDPEDLDMMPIVSFDLCFEDMNFGSHAFANDVDYDPEEMFRTLRFGFNMLSELECIKPGNISFFNTDTQVSFVESFKNQLMDLAKKDVIEQPKSMVKNIANTLAEPLAYLAVAGMVGAMTGGKKQAKVKTQPVKELVEMNK